MDQAGGIDQSELHNSINSHLGATKDNGGLLQAAQDPPRHGTKPSRPWFYFRLEKTAKGIQVVTEDAGAIAGELVNQVSIAVIADMERVEIVSLFAEQMRVIPKSSQESVDIPSRSLAAKPRQMLKASSHAGLNAFGVHLARRLRLPEEHVGHQIHAGPVLLSKITDES
jgi:hypothetical protein